MCVISSLKPTSWTKLSGRLKSNFACCIKEVTESCARSQENELQLEPGLYTKSELGYGSQGNSRHRCCWENKKIRSFLWILCQEPPWVKAFSYDVLYSLQIMPQFVHEFLINGSRIFLARSTGKEFALKIIDKAKCCGKVEYNNLHL